MSYIPDCRTDEVYNENNLNELDKEFIAGYDFALNQVFVDLIGNLDLYDFDIDGVDFNLVTLLDNHPEVKKALYDAMCSYHEMFRDELITSMIESYPDDITPMTESYPDKEGDDDN